MKESNPVILNQILASRSIQPVEACLRVGKGIIQSHPRSIHGARITIDRDMQCSPLVKSTRQWTRTGTLTSRDESFDRKGRQSIIIIYHFIINLRKRDYLQSLKKVLLYTNIPFVLEICFIISFKFEKKNIEI